MAGDPFADAIPLGGDVGTVRTRVLASARAVRAVRHGALREHAREWLWRHDEKRLLLAARQGRDVAWPADAGGNDLVTVRITTYGRPDLLVERTLPSVLGQTHERLDVLVVGDGADAETEKALRSVKDTRVRYVNLPYRPWYPAEDRDRWKVLGYQALNVSLDLALGAWIAPGDDDDEFTPGHITDLLTHAVRERAELVHSKTAIHLGSQVFGVIGGARPAEGRVSHGSLLYSTGLRFFRYNAGCWRMRRPLDWDLVVRMIRAGVRTSYLDEVTYVYHPSAASRAVWVAEAVRRRPELAGRLGQPGGVLAAG